MFNSKLRYVLMAVLALTLAFVPAVSLHPARAQGADCLPGLNADACALLNDAFTSSGTLTKFVMDYTLDIVAGDNTVNVVGNGPIDLTQLMSNAEALSSDPTAALAGLTMQQTITSNSVTDGKTEGGTFEFRIVNGFLYFKSDEESDGAWQKLDLAKAVAAMQEGGSDAMGGMTGGMDTEEAQAMGMQLLGALMSPELQALFSDPSDFLAASVSDGGNVDGVSTQKITLNIKFGAIVGALAKPEAAPALAAIGKAFGLPEGQEMMLVGMVQMFQPILNSSTFAISWWVDPAAKQFRGFGLNIALTVDAQTQMMLGGGAGSGAGATAMPKDVEVKIDFLVTLSAIGDNVVVEPVADAVEINVDEAMEAATN